MIRPSQIFTDINSVGNRARCPKCGDGKSNYPVQIEPDHAYCHRCQHTWHFEDNKIDKMPDIKPPIVREPLYVKSSGAVKKSNYREHRENFLNYSNKVIKKLQLPWNETARDSRYGIGVRNNNEEMQLVFRINENHIKRHKGEQFGDAECKIYPNIADINPTGTLLICEGEKDAFRA